MQKLYSVFLLSFFISLIPSESKGRKSFVGHLVSTTLKKCRVQKRRASMSNVVSEPDLCGRGVSQKRRVQILSERIHTTEAELRRLEGKVISLSVWPSGYQAMGAPINPAYASYLKYAIDQFYSIKEAECKENRSLVLQLRYIKEKIQEYEALNKQMLLEGEVHVTPAEVEALKHFERFKEALNQKIRIHNAQLTRSKNNLVKSRKVLLRTLNKVTLQTVL